MQTRRRFLGNLVTAIVAARALNGAQLERILADELPATTEVIVRPLSVIDQVLKDLYLPAVREQLNRQSLLLEGVEWS